MTQRLGEKSLLASFTRDDASKLLALSDEIDFVADEVILRSGEKSQYFYVLLEGSVVVEVIERSFSMCVQTLGPGDAFGWSAVLQASETLFQVRAREACRVACIDGSRLAALCYAEPEFGVRLLMSVLRIVANRVHGTELRLAEFCVSPTSATS